MPKVTDEHREQRREQILMAAMTCVAEEGFHKTTMAHVIAQSGLSAGAVYGYFRSKDELILAIAERSLSYLDQAIDTLQARDPLPSPVEATHLLTAMIVERAEASPVDLTRVAVSAWAEAVRNEEVRHAVASRIDFLRSKYADVIIAQQSAGHIDADTDPEMVAKSFFGILPGFILQRLITRDVTPADYAAGFAALRRPSGD